MGKRRVVRKKECGVLVGNNYENRKARILTSEEPGISDHCQDKRKDRVPPISANQKEGS